MNREEVGDLPHKSCCPIPITKGRRNLIIYPYGRRSGLKQYPMPGNSSPSPYCKSFLEALLFLIGEYLIRRKAMTTIYDMTPTYLLTFFPQTSTKTYETPPYFDLLPLTLLLTPTRSYTVYDQPSVKGTLLFPYFLFTYHPKCRELP